MFRRATPRRGLLSALLLMGATVIAYLPALRAGFIWNDSDYVTRPDLRSLHGLWRLWFEPGVVDQYYPVLYSAFWVEHRLWGDHPLPYHLVNILWHAGSAWVLVLILRRLWKDLDAAAWFAGLLFALHPVGVESVAWVTEQKNTLSTLFYLLAALAYLRFAGRGGAPLASASAPPARTRPAAAYALATVLYLLALLTKTVTAALPGALLVVIWWRQENPGPKAGGASLPRRLVRAVAPLLPWFVAGGAAGLFTAWIERHYVGAEGASFVLTPAEHLTLAARIICFYLGKLLWPGHLVFIYPRWNVRPMADGALYVAVVIALLLAAWAPIRLFGSSPRTRAPLAALLIFIGSLFPALGFFNVYAFLFSFVADHFQYLATIPIFAVAAGGWGALARGRARPLVPSCLLPAILLFGLGALSFRESRIYLDDQALYTATLARNPGAWMAQNNLGNLLFAQGRFEEAIPRYREALRLQPDFADAHYNLANSLAKAGRLEEALSEYAEAVRLKPGDVRVRNDFGGALVAAGRTDEGIAQYAAALRIDPGLAPTYYNLGIAYGKSHRLPEAIESLEAALRIQPDYPEAENNLGAALAEEGRWRDAIGHFRRAIRLDPGNARAHQNLSNALARTGDWDGARREVEAADRIERP